MRRPGSWSSHLCLSAEWASLACAQTLYVALGVFSVHTLTRHLSDVCHTFLRRLHRPSRVPMELRSLQGTLAAYNSRSCAFVRRTLSDFFSVPDVSAGRVIGLAVMVGSKNNIARYVMLHLCIGGAVSTIKSKERPRADRFFFFFR